MAGTAAFTLSAEDYGAMQRTVFHRHLQSRRFVRRMAVLVVASSAASAAGFFLLGESLWSAAWLGLGTAFLGLVAVSLLIGTHLLLLPRRARKAFAQQRMLHHPVEVAWNADGIRWQTPRGVTTYPWNDYVAWQRTPRLFLLYASDFVVYAVPVRALATADEADLAQAAAAGGLPTR